MQNFQEVGGTQFGLFDQIGNLPKASKCVNLYQFATWNKRSLFGLFWSLIQITKGPQRSKKSQKSPKCPKMEHFWFTWISEMNSETPNFWILKNRHLRQTKFRQITKAHGRLRPGFWVLLHMGKCPKNAKKFGTNKQTNTSDFFDP